MAATRAAAWLRRAGLLLALSLFARALWGTDLRSAGGLLRAAGPALLLAPLPWALALLFDSLAFRLLLGRVGPAPALGRVYSVRMAAEAVASSLPGGVVVSESLLPALFQRAAGLAAPPVLAAMAARKWLQTRAQAITLLAAALAAFPLLRALAPRLPGGAALPWLACALPLLPLCGSLLVRATLLGGGSLLRLQLLLQRLPGRLGRFFAQQTQAFHHLDRHAAALGAGPTLLPTLLYLAAWLCETLETWLLLRLLGAGLGLPAALALEGPLGLVRSLAFFAPAGLGVQDGGYLLALGALGLPRAAALGGAFLLLKRGKELLWAAAGWPIALTLGARGPLLANAAAHPIARIDEEAVTE
jgi:hypothetical protein